MLIKKLPGAAPESRPANADSGPPLDPNGSRALSSLSPDDSATGTAKLDALSLALGSGAALPRGAVLQDRYEVEQVLGVGGMSTVYRARDLRFTNVLRYCAIKEMPDNAPDPKTGALRLANFEREASLLATLSHPGIPKIYDFFTHMTRVYLVLEYIDGKDLELILDEANAPLDESLVLQWAVQVCDVLTYLHSHQPTPIVFRDLKPSNVMTHGGIEKITLVDFGIAKAFQNDKKGTMIGTEGYSPPEQYRGQSDARGDIYALGATLHHLLTNSDPRSETPFTFHERPVRQLNPLVSTDTEAVVTRALEYDAARRWESAAAMKAALRGIIEGRAVGRAGRLSSAPMAASASFPDFPPAPTLAAPTVAAAPRAGGAPPAAVAGEPAAVPTTRQLWAFTAEDEIRSSPTVTKGLLVVGSYDTNLYALSARTGEFVWKRATEGGIPSSPLVWEDLVLVGSEDHKVYAIDVRKGTVQWTQQTAGPVRSSPRSVLDRIYVGSDDQYLYCLDARTGRVHWKYRTWGPVRSSPAIGRQLVFVGSGDGNVYAIEPATGMMKWKFHSSGPITSSPVVHEGLVYIGSADQHIYAIDVDTGWAVWRFRTDHYVTSTPAVSGGRVFIGSVDGHLYALEATGGRLVWKFATGSQVTSSPRLAGAAVVFGAVDNHVYCLGQAKGDLRWRYPTSGPVTSSPFIEDGCVYIGSLDHKLYALAL